MFNGEVIDKRKEKLAAEAVPAAPTVLDGPAQARANEEIYKHNAIERKKTVRGEVQVFKSIGYTLVYIQANPQPLLSGRAVGLRTDDKVFTADWLLPPVWDEETNWQAEAKRRLLTFKSCACDRDGRCKFHGEACPGRMTPGKWLEEDMQRLQKLNQTPLCEALEILMKAEMARSQQRIVTPQ